MITVLHLPNYVFGTINPLDDDSVVEVAKANFDKAVIVAKSYGNKQTVLGKTSTIEWCELHGLRGTQVGDIVIEDGTAYAVGAFKFLPLKI